MAKDEAEYQRERQREHAENGKPMVWALVFAAAINGGGKNAQGASKIADEAVAAFVHRFINDVPPLEAD